MNLRILLFVGLVTVSGTISVNAQDPEPKPAPRDVVITRSTVQPKAGLEKIDLSDWVRPDSRIGNTDFVNGELLVSSKQRAYYYVLAATEEYVTVGGRARVTLRNVYGGDSSLGYGLIFHSDPTPLRKGYAFVIDTIRQKYRVVHHVPGDEKTLVPWKASAFINAGKAKNTLEIRDKGDVTELYINDKLVESVKNTFAFKDGVIGLYSGDAITIAFSDLNLSIAEPSKP